MESLALTSIQFPDSLSYLISPAGSAMPYSTDESLYDAVSDGQKLRATLPAVVGPLG
jgi:hypothetical protein